MTDQIAKQEAMNPGQLLALAVDKNLDIDKLRQLMDLQKEWQADQARKMFFESFTSFQAECPDIRKNKPVEFNGKLQYKYAPLADITRQISKSLKKFDLSYRWEIQDNGEKLQVTFIVSHVGGHSERTTMTAAADPSGSKNAIQARGSAIEYLKRYTLIGGLGISTADEDIDGRMPEVDIDKLHKDYMEVYNQIIQIDSSLTKYDPSNWKVEATPKIYIKAVGELRKVLHELKSKGK